MNKNRSGTACGKNFTLARDPVTQEIHFTFVKPNKLKILITEFIYWNGNKPLQSIYSLTIVEYNKFEMSVPSSVFQFSFKGCRPRVLP